MERCLLKLAKIPVWPLMALAAALLDVVARDLLKKPVGAVTLVELL